MLAAYRHLDRSLLLLAVLASGIGCRAMHRASAPSNWRSWSPDQAVLSSAEFEEDQITVHNIRNCHYLDEETYVVDYYDRTFSLRDVQSVDFIICPFKDSPAIAHTMLSFGIENDQGDRDYLAVSVEIRREDDEAYSAWKGFFRQYELMYVVADERDVIHLRTTHWNEDVYLYPSTASPRQARDLLVDVMRRANQLLQEPEFYHTVTNNCTTNIVRHINRLHPDRIAADYRVLLPGHSDRLAYDLGLIERQGTFAETKRLAYITPLARRLEGEPRFSGKLRGQLQTRLAAGGRGRRRE